MKKRSRSSTQLLLRTPQRDRQIRCYNKPLDLVLHRQVSQGCRRRPLVCLALPRLGLQESSRPLGAVACHSLHFLRTVFLLRICQLVFHSRLPAASPQTFRFRLQVPPVAFLLSVNNLHKVYQVDLVRSLVPLPLQVKVRRLDTVSALLLA